MSEAWLWWVLVTVGVSVIATLETWEKVACMSHPTAKECK